MHFAVTEFRQLFKRNLCVVIGEGANRERNQDFVHVQARVLVAELLGLQVLNRFDHHRRKQTHFVGDSC